MHMEYNNTEKKARPYNNTNQKIIKTTKNNVEYHVYKNINTLYYRHFLIIFNFMTPVN